MQKMQIFFWIYLNIFIHDFLPQNLNFALFNDICRPLFPAAGYIELTITETVQNLFDMWTRSFCLKIWVRDLLHK